MLGVLLVLVTWLGCTAILIGSGLVIASWAAPTGSRATVARTALWWGMTIIVLLVLVASLVAPLRSTAAAVIVGIPVVVLVVIGVLVMRRRDPALRTDRSWRGWSAVALAGMALGTCYLAVTALGPVTNYDSGLYHLGAIRYAGDYAAIPGLANLYFPFGYNTSTFPLAAFLGNGPWDGQGFRLLNGLVLVLMAVDLTFRLRQRRFSVGTYVLALGLVVAWVPMIGLADYWVTSPSQDSAVLALSIVSAAYLADAVSAPRSLGRDGAVALAVAVVLVSMRPLMGAFALATVAVIGLLLWRRRRAARRSWGPVAVAAGLGILLAAAQSARDVVLSGWLQFPLAFLPFDVPWRAPDPGEATRATLGAARDPADLWDAAQGWGWVPGWLSRLPGQWETALFALLVIAALVAVVLAWRVGRPPGRALLAALAPSVLTVVVWWTATPPSFRFVWGPLFLLAILPLAWSLRNLALAGRSWSAGVRPLVLGGVGVALGAVVLGSVATRLEVSSWTQDRAFALGPVSLAYRVAPVPVPEVVDHEAQGGLVIHTPLSTDQCWDAYPLCVGSLPVTLRQRGPSLQDGFTP